MAITSTSPTLTNDHIDLLVTAAARWQILTDPTTAAFAGDHHLGLTPTQAGQQLRQENLAATAHLADQGSLKPADLVDPGPYTHEPIQHVDPVEVIKAVHAAQHACAPSPRWQHGTARKLLTAVATAATYRLPGYADAPWLWTRPQRRTGMPLGIATGDDYPPIPGLQWHAPGEQLHDLWAKAPLVLITPAAALELPADLAARSGVFILTTTETQAKIWLAVRDLKMQTGVLHWPTCEPWLTGQLREPSPEYAEHRTA
ncbi:hypothetical protein ACFQ80_05595 [Isoptericola sp. NPDC056578]|uniref:hypothetical protein n=1 Tax=Isoptericola sp. NPDC056578 TaxID=3345870 RepID=UPI00367F0149